MPHYMKYLDFLDRATTDWDTSAYYNVSAVTVHDLWPARPAAAAEGEEAPAAAAAAPAAGAGVATGAQTVALGATPASDATTTAPAPEELKHPWWEFWATWGAKSLRLHG